MAEDQKSKICPIIDAQIESYREVLQNIYRREVSVDELLIFIVNNSQAPDFLRKYCSDLICSVKY